MAQEVDKETWMSLHCRYWMTEVPSSEEGEMHLDRWENSRGVYIQADFRLEPRCKEPTQ